MKTRTCFVSNSSSSSVVLKDRALADSVCRSLGISGLGRPATRLDFLNAVASLASAWYDRRMAQAELSANGVKDIAQVKDKFERHRYVDAVARNWSRASRMAAPLELSQGVKDAVELAVSSCSVSDCGGWKRLVPSPGSRDEVSKAVRRQAESYDLSGWSSYESVSSDLVPYRDDGRLALLWSRLRKAGAFWSENS